MSTEESPGAGFLERLIRRVAAHGEVRAAYAGGPLARGQADPWAELDLVLIAPASVGGELAAWLSSREEAAFVGEVPGGCRAITADGLVVNIAVADGPEQVDMRGMERLFERTGAGGGTPGRAGEPPPAGGAAVPEAVAGGGKVGDATGVAAPGGDLAREAAWFWADLYRAAGALGQGRLLTAHGRLEPCRTRLLDLYRLALAPDRPGRGYEGVELLPGAQEALERVLPWLTCPLEARELWRCAHRLAVAYESLVLPLCERLGLAYPYPVRNLAFRRLDEVRPERLAAAGGAGEGGGGPAEPGAGPGPGAAGTAAEPGPGADGGTGRRPARFRIARRGR